MKIYNLKRDKKIIPPYTTKLVHALLSCSFSVKDAWHIPYVGYSWYYTMQQQSSGHLYTQYHENVIVLEVEASFMKHAKPVQSDVS